ncbi:hypothetical protein LEMLEM_LOCUS14072, partial [Lemmus lemmus]
MPGTEPENDNGEHASSEIFNLCMCESSCTCPLQWASKYCMCLGTCMLHMVLTLHVCLGTCMPHTLVLSPPACVPWH